MVYMDPYPHNHAVHGARLRPDRTRANKHALSLYYIVYLNYTFYV